MSFCSQTWSGIKQEFIIYRHHPRLLLQECASVILSSLMSLSNSNHLLPHHYTRLLSGYANYLNHKKEPPVFLDVLCASIIFYSPASAVLNKLIRDKDSKFRQYLMVLLLNGDILIIQVNGMKKSSYQAKIAITSYVLMFFVIFELFSPIIEIDCSWKEHRVYSI